MGTRRREEIGSSRWIAAVAALLLLSWPLPGCVERRSPEEPEIVAHPPEFNDAYSADFHGARVLARGASSCTVCHGEEYDGAAGVPSCYQCHDGAGGHPFGWANPGASFFHGAEVASAGPEPCALCHGADYLGGWSEVSCSRCHAGGPSGHPDGWLNSASASFHGRRAALDGVTSCARCHGLPPSDGTSGVSCADCHG